MKKVLIANRGEIAIRIIRACQELGIKTVAIHSTADRNSLHAKLAEESVCIGPGESAKSYLNIPAIMSAAEVTGVDAIHPGYGFLAENANFAKICSEYKITWIGPSPNSINLLGDKIQARKLAIKAKVPLLPGSNGVIKNKKELDKISEKIGFPLIIKAAAGGGGRGMKVVTKKEDLHQMFALATTEAKAYFDNPDCFVERYAQNPRHIEIQVMADKHGNVVHLGERDCSIQRRHQKLIEEAPSSVLNPKLRSEMGKVAVRLIQKANYESLGTVEFLLDSKNRFYFMEVNTRIQVEHTVTEEVTDIDLVKEQINIARGRKLSITKKDVEIRGHSIECRINAEDPKTFAPWPGKVTAYHEPGGLGVRIDSMIYPGYVVPSNYDSMVLKLIVTGRDRDEAIMRMKRALNEMKIDGIRTNISFHLEVLANKSFLSGDISTNFLNEAGFVSN